MGHDPHGRRHATPAWLDLASGQDASRRGHKLVVQMLQTYHKGGESAFVETLDAIAVGSAAHMPLPPVMIYGDSRTSSPRRESPTCTGRPTSTSVATHLPRSQR